VKSNALAGTSADPEGCYYSRWNDPDFVLHVTDRKMKIEKEPAEDIRPAGSIYYVLPCIATSGFADNFRTRYFPDSSGCSQLSCKLRIIQFSFKAHFNFPLTKFQIDLKSHFVTFEINLIDSNGPVHAAHVCVDFQSLLTNPSVRCNFEIPFANNRSANPCSLSLSLSLFRLEYAGKYISPNGSFKCRFTLTIRVFAFTFESQLASFVINQLPTALEIRLLR